MDDKLQRRPPVVRGEVPARSRYQEYRQDLRSDFWFSCAYCTMTEHEASGLSFEIDHYLPRAKHPQLQSEYENLMYSCMQCNRNKGDLSPEVDGFPPHCYFIRPDHEHPAEHLALEDLRYVPVTDTGEFNIQALGLNRQILRRLRKLRERLGHSQNFIANGIADLARLPLDQIRKEWRAQVLWRRKKIGESYKALHDMIRDLARSELLDEDPQRVELASRRRKHLNEMKALAHAKPSGR